MSSKYLCLLQTSGYESEGLSQWSVTSEQLNANTRDTLPEPTSPIVDSMGYAKKPERRKAETVEGGKQPPSSEALPKVEGSQRGVDGNGGEEWVAVQRRKKASPRGEGKVYSYMY